MGHGSATPVKGAVCALGVTTYAYTDLPPALAHMANVTARGVTHYRFDVPAKFSYRAREWLAQVEADRSVAYGVTVADNGRVYLEVSFTPAASPQVPTLDGLRSTPDLRVLAID